MSSDPSTVSSALGTPGGGAGSGGGGRSRVTVDGVDYHSLFRFTRIFQSFRIAIHPSRLLLALLLIMLLYAAGRALDSSTPHFGKGVIWGSGLQPIPLEFQEYVRRPTREFDEWRESNFEAVRDDARRGVFESAMAIEMQLFERMIRAAVTLQPGFDQLIPNTPPNENTVLGALRLQMMLPVWIWHTHKWFLVIWVVIFVLLWSLFAGAISRQAVVDAAQERVTPAVDAFAFAFRRWGWYIFAPLLPLIIMGIVAGLMAAYGLLYNVFALDVLAALGLILALFLGFFLAMVLVLWLAGVHLIYPALSAEGVDAFDAVTRAFSFVWARPWRMILYSLLALVYGALTYLFVGLIIFLTIAITREAVDWGVFVNVGTDEMLTGDVEKWDALFPPPVFGQLAYEPAWEPLGHSGDISAVIVMVWVYMLIGLLGAYAISYYISSFSVIYLMLRRYVDGTDMSQVYQEPAPAVAAEKVEPAGA